MRTLSSFHTKNIPFLEIGIPVLYNILFLPINGYYVLRYLLNREALALQPEV